MFCSTFSANFRKRTDLMDKPQEYEDVQDVIGRSAKHDASVRHAKIMDLVVLRLSMVGCC